MLIRITWIISKHMNPPRTDPMGEANRNSVAELQVVYVHH